MRDEDDDIDTWQLLEYEDGLPHPRSDLLEFWGEQRRAAGDWRALLRKWLSELAEALEDDVPYRIYEGPGFLLLSPYSKGDSAYLLRHAANCRQTLVAVLPEIAQFQAPGGDVLLAFESPEHYYRFTSPGFSEGEYGGSGGMFHREGYPHIALNAGGGSIHFLDAVVAHELTHASLAHLTMPVWIEEGLAQMFEHDMAPQRPFLVDAQMGRAHRKFWREEGLDGFWSGTSFHSAGEGQKLSYELAQIFMRTLISDFRPQWFGFVRAPQLRLMAFLRDAQGWDYGDSAAREHLDRSLAEIAAGFLGPGDWSPS